MDRKRGRPAKVKPPARPAKPVGPKTIIKRHKSSLPTLSSTLTMAFAHLDGGWQDYIRFVEIAAKEGDDDMKRLLDHYNTMTATARKNVTPEDLCQLVIPVVSVKTLLASIMPWIWTYSNAAAGVIAAVSNPAVIAKTAKMALGKSRDAHKDRELMLKITGALPTAKGSQTIINNTPTATASAASASSSSGLPIRLPSAGQDIMELEAAEIEELEEQQEVRRDHLDDKTDQQLAGVAVGERTR